VPRMNPASIDAVDDASWLLLMIRSSMCALYA
jgi:hypothetical protein